MNVDKVTQLTPGLPPGDVLGGDRGNPGRDRAGTVCQDPGAALQADRQVCLQPPLPGG